MYFLQSCKIIYADLSTKSVDECEGITSIFSMPSISLLDVLILLTIILITTYFILKIILLFRNQNN